MLKNLLIFFVLFTFFLNLFFICMLFASILSRREESCLSESGHSLRLQEHSKTLATNSKATAALTQINTLFTGTITGMYVHIHHFY